MLPLYMVQYTAKIDKNIKKIFVVQYYGHLKELFDFNEISKIYFSRLFS